MRKQARANMTHDESHVQDGATRQAILELLQSRNMRPGDSINIILAQFEIERRGIDNNKFSTGVVQLLDSGVLDMQGNAFYLTHAGFEALRHGKEHANA